MSTEIRTLWSAKARFDIEALRAFAVVSVIAFHAGFAFAPSGYIGVDVFFVISGYLIIGLLHREAELTGRVRLFAFWARRARRLLPAASLVLAFIGLITWGYAGRLVQLSIHQDIYAATLFGANLRFGLTGVDYWAVEYESPVLHYWSLGIEEQFYIVIPIAITVMAWLSRPLRGAARQWLPLVLLGSVAAVSFAYSMHLSNADTVWNYFSPLSRVWEFALGGLAALWPAKSKPRPALRRALAPLLWLTLAASMALIPSEAGWPNRFALVPVLATVALLRVGRDSRTAAQALGSGRLRWARHGVAWLGGISYSAYLWHWPLLWLAAAATGTARIAELAPWLSLLAVAATFWFSSMTKYLVEDPIRFSPRLVRSPARSLASGWGAAGATALAVTLSTALPAVSLAPAPVVAEPTAPAVVADNPGWLTELIEQLVPKSDRNAVVSSISPGPADLVKDRNLAQLSGCQPEIDQPDPTGDCAFGDLASDREIALFGDSHAGQFVDGLALAAETLGYKLLSRTRNGCPPATVSKYMERLNGAYALCDSFREKTIREFIERKPQLVIMTSFATTRQVIDPFTGTVVTDDERGKQLWADGYRITLTRLAQAGIPVLVVRDTPMWGFNVPDCLATYPAANCAPPTSSVLGPREVDLEVGNTLYYSRAIDLTLAICEPDLCYPIRGNTIVMRDHSHISTEYSRILARLWRAILLHELEAEPNVLG